MYDSKRVLLLIATSVAFSLAGCGGGGGNAPSTVNQAATIIGSTSGQISSIAPSANGTLTVTDPDPGQATFSTPTNLYGTYGNWSFKMDGATATWSYTVQTTKLPSLVSGQTLTESLKVSSLDGSAVVTLQVTVVEPKASTVTSVAKPSYGATSPELQVFNYLNMQRAKCGFGLLAQNVQLDKAALAHANYILANNEATHTETASNPGFTGVNPSDRMTAAGYSVWSNTEAISFRATGLEGIRSLLAAPYHSQAAMWPFRDIGISFQTTSRSQFISETLVLDIAVNASVASYQQPLPNTLLTFPCEGSSDLAPAFSEAENWAAPTGVGTGGAPLIVMAPNFEPITVTSAQLSTATGTVVPTSILTNDKDPQKIFTNDPNIVLVIPPSSLQPNSGYKWDIAGTIAGIPFTRSFSFSTGAKISSIN